MQLKVGTEWKIMFLIKVLTARFQNVVESLKPEEWMLNAHCSLLSTSFWPCSVVMAELGSVWTPERLSY